MSRIPYAQSAFAAAKDQLYLDSAEGRHLDRITSSAGFDRPHGGYDDEKWRAISRALMLRDRACRDAFRRLLEVCLGPRRGRAGDLTAALAKGARILTLAEGSDELVRIGRVRVDPGLATEETITFYDYRPYTREVKLHTPTRHAHLARTPWSARITADVAEGATAIVVDSVGGIPAAPFSMLLDQETENAEPVAVLSVNTGTKTLTTKPTTKAHKGPALLPHHMKLARAALAKQLVLVLVDEDARRLAAKGHLYLEIGAGVAEVVEYTEVEADTGLVKLAQPLTSAHARDAPIDAARPGALCRSCTVLQESAGWDTWVSAETTLAIYVPARLLTLRARDALYLHGAVPPPFSTTLAANANIGDEQVSLSGAGELPQEAAILDVDGELAFYNELEEDAAPDPLAVLPEPIVANHGAGQPVDLYRVPYADAPLLEDGNVALGNGAFDRGKFAGKYLYEPGKEGYGQTEAVLSVDVPFPCELVADSMAGRVCVEIRDASLWPSSGYDVRIGNGTGRREDRTVAGRVLKGVSTTVVGAHSSGDPTITCAATGSFPSSASPLGYRLKAGTLEVRVRRNAANVFTLEAPLPGALAGGETVELLADVLTLATILSNTHRGTQHAPDVAGHKVEFLATELSLVDGSELPTDNGLVIINHRHARPSVRMRIAGVAGADVTVVPPAELRAAVAVDATAGDQTVSIKNAGAFPTGGSIEAPLALPVVFDPGNAGQEQATILIHDREGGAVTLLDQLANNQLTDVEIRALIDVLPLDHFPYQILLGPNRGKEERANVASYDQAAGVVTLSGAPTGSFAAGDWLEYRAGEQEVVRYETRVGNKLLLREPTVIGGHRRGEPVTLCWSDDATPDERAAGHQWFLPPTPGWCLIDILDRVRALGVNVALVTSR